MITAGNISPRTWIALKDLETVISKLPANVQSYLASFNIYVGWFDNYPLMFPGIDIKLDKPEKVYILRNENDVAIFGRDVPDVPFTSPDRAGNPILNTQHEYGTINAIYTFIKEYLGVLFFYPGDSGMYIPDTILLPENNTVYAPSIRDRDSAFHLCSFASNKGSKADKLWSARNRVLHDSLNTNPGHAFGDYWERFGTTHPEYFALIETTGKREPWKGNARIVKMCITNPGLHQQWLVDVEQDLLTNPNKMVFSAAENDGWNTGFCSCENCMQIGTQREQTKRQIWFANTLARLLRKKYPGKYVSILAYGHSRIPPEPTVRIERNVIIAGVHNFLLRNDSDSDERTVMMYQYAGWAAVARNLVFRPNIGNPGAICGSQGMADFDLPEVIADFAFLRKHGCVGLWFDLFWMHWATQFPLYWVVAQLAYKPKQDTQRLLSQFYSRCFGPAEESMRAYYQLLQDTRRKMITEVAAKNRKPYLSLYFTPELFGQLEVLITTAKGIAANTQYEPRVSMAADGLTFMKSFVAGERIAPIGVMNWNKVEFKDTTGSTDLE